MLTNKNELISIIMPAYNSAKYIADAINSVINQSYSNWELIIIDDGSNDGTEKIVDEFSRKDSRIKVYHIENHGVAHARNLGLDKAIGEWIFFLDSDDLISEDALEKLLAESDGFDYVIGNYIEFGKNASTHEPYDCSLRSKEEIYEYAMKTNYFPLFNTVWGGLLKKDTITVRFDEDCQAGEDTEFGPRYVKNISSIRMIKDIVYRYRKGNETSLSYDVRRYTPEIRSKIFCALRDYYGDNPRKMTWCYNGYVWWAIRYVNIILADDSLTEEEKKTEILGTVSTEFIKSIEKEGYYLSTRIMRRWIALKMGDMDIIKEVFKDYDD